MCEPVTLAAIGSQIAGAVGAMTGSAAALGTTTAVLGGASAVAGHIGQTQMANYQDQVYEQNRILAERAASQESSMLDVRQQQQSAAIGEERFANQRDTRAAIAAARVAQGAAGITGMTPSLLLAEIAGRGGSNDTTLDRNLSMARSQTQMEKLGVDTSRQSRINSVQKGVRPTLLGTSLKIAGAGLDGATTYRAAKGR